SSAQGIPPGCGMYIDLSGYTRGVCVAGHGTWVSCVYGEANCRHAGRSPARGGCGSPAEAEAGHWLHPAVPSVVATVYRTERYARQAVGDADEPQPTEPWPHVGRASQPDAEPESDRRLRCALHRRDVSN